MTGTDAEHQRGEPAALAADAPDGSGRRRTRQREAITGFLAGQNTFQTAQDIHAGLRVEGTAIGLATVYRALQSMVESCEVDVLRGDDGEATYRRCGVAGHHHHLVCRSCGHTVEVLDEPVARWSEEVATEHGFVEIEHRVEVFGLCARCATRGRPPA